MHEPKQGCENEAMKQFERRYLQWWYKVAWASSSSWFPPARSAHRPNGIMGRGSGWIHQNIRAKKWRGNSPPRLANILSSSPSSQSPPVWPRVYVLDIYFVLPLCHCYRTVYFLFLPVWLGWVTVIYEQNILFPPLFLLLFCAFREIEASRLLPSHPKLLSFRRERGISLELQLWEGSQLGMNGHKCVVNLWLAKNNHDSFSMIVWISDFRY